MDTHLQDNLQALLNKALEFRVPLLDEKHAQGLRLFNGYTEGAPDLVVDLFGRTLVLFSHHSDVTQALTALRDVRAFYLAQFPWLTCVVEKYRNAMDDSKPKGIIMEGKLPDTQITENGIHYALDLMLNRDASFYLDTRNLRQWITAHCQREILSSILLPIQAAWVSLLSVEEQSL